MKTTIYKYQLDTTDKQTITMPKGAKILCIQTENDIPCIWAVVNPNEHSEDRYFEIYGTGHYILTDNKKMIYIGTYQLYDGKLIFHCFECFK